MGRHNKKVVDSYELEIDGIELDELMSLLSNNLKDDVKSFDDIINLDEALDRTAYIGDITTVLGTTISSLIRFWNKWDDKHNIAIEDRKPIKLYINSNGGDLDGTFTIIDAIRLSNTPVWVINEGKAYSGGFFIFIAGHKRFAYEHSSFLYHEGSTGTQGTAGQFQNYTAFYKKQLDQLKDIVLKYTNITEEQYKEIHKDDYWMTAEEALQDCVCDVILEGH